MTTFQTRLAPPSLLERTLPGLVRDLSLARAQIALDQIHGAVASSAPEQIVLAIASRQPDGPPLAAAIAVRPAPPAGQTGDTATIVHAGFLDDAGESGRDDMIAALSARLLGELRQRGVRFVQWATEVMEPGCGNALARWCAGFGFEPIGTLDYMGGQIPAAQATPHAETGRDSTGQSLRLQAFDWDRPDHRGQPPAGSRPGALDRLAGLVERTYVQTLDCPGMARYRTAAQTLRSYRSSAAFDPQLWFYAFDDAPSPVGCLILARHVTTAAVGESPAAPVIELVYMGLVPQSRGRGRGQQLLQHAFDAARQTGANRLILAVDRGNTPARRTYLHSGLQPMLSETVWVRLLA